MLADVGLQPGVGAEHFLLVIWVGVVENNVTDHDQELLSLSAKASSKRLLPRDIN